MPSEDTVVSVVGLAVGILASTLPGPGAAILKAAEPYLGELVKLIDLLRGGSDPEELRRAVGPSDQTDLKEALGGIQPEAS